MKKTVESDVEKIPTFNSNEALVEWIKQDVLKIKGACEQHVTTWKKVLALAEKRLTILKNLVIHHDTTGVFKDIDVKFGDPTLAAMCIYSFSAPVLTAVREMNNRRQDYARTYHELSAHKQTSVLANDMYASVKELNDVNEVLEVVRSMYSRVNVVYGERVKSEQFSINSLKECFRQCALKMDYMSEEFEHDPRRNPEELQESFGFMTDGAFLVSLYNNEVWRANNVVATLGWLSTEMELLRDTMYKHLEITTTPVPELGGSIVTGLPARRR